MISKRKVRALLARLWEHADSLERQGRYEKKVIEEIRADLRKKKYF